MGVRGVVWWGVVVAAAVVCEAQQRRSGFAGIPGNYCRNRRPSECCDDRWDDCAVPIQGTLCYCDEFCLNGPHAVLNDCCPDFEEVCLGVKPRPHPRPPIPFQEDPNQDCDVRGVKIPLGAAHTFNCNKCTCTGATVECEIDQCMVEADLINAVNAGVRYNGWMATNYTQFWGRKAKDGLVLRTGTRMPDMEIPMHPVLLRPDGTQIPRHFDARVAWGGRVTGVRDQGWCGASWAFSTLAVAQDRLNIMAKGITPLALSPQHLLSCSKLGHDDCQSGQVDRAWNYLRLRGVVMDECFHYESGSSGKVPKCAKQQEAEHNAECMNVYRTEPPYRISGKEEDIQWEILTNGPVQAMMKVYPDLFVYATGVYRHTGLGGEASASHSVKIIGWGEAQLNGQGMVKYWLVQNSWGRNWGERGLFRIRRGVNECGIESFVVAARARLANAMYGHEIPYTVDVLEGQQST